MAWHPTLYTVIAAVAVVPLGGFAVVGWRQGKATATTFGWLTASALVWGLCYGVQLGYSTRAEQLPWQAATLAASALVPPLLLLFALRYAGRTDLVTRGLRAVLAADVIGFAILVFTNRTHGLVWSDAVLQETPTTPTLLLTFGTGYYVHIVFAYTVVVVAFAVLLSVLFRSVSIYDKQVSLLVLGALPPFGFHIAYTLGISPIHGLDFTPFAFSITTVLYGLALFHFDLLNRLPIAQQRALALVGDGLLVSDGRGEVVEANDIASQILEDDAGADLLQRLRDERSVDGAEGVVVTGTVDGARRVYDCHAAPLEAEYGGFTGYTVVFRDITERNAYEQRLEVSNRVLRHNLRNDLNVVRGYAGLLAETADDSRERWMAETIDRTAADLVSLSEKLRRAIALERGAEHATVDDVRSVVGELVDSFRQQYPEAAFTFDGRAADPAAISGVGDAELSLAVRNLLENAVEHNDRQGLAVSVTVATTPERVRIVIHDTGSGLPDDERAVLESNTETQLQHSSGVGLWLTRWIVQAANGRLEVASGGDGTSITIDLPRADESVDGTASESDQSGVAEPSP